MLPATADRGWGSDDRRSGVFVTSLEGLAILGTLATVGAFVIALVQFRRHRTSPQEQTSEAWRQIWSSDDDLTVKIQRANQGVPLDFFDLLYVTTVLHIDLLDDGDAMITWKYDAINWGDEPIEADSLEVEIDPPGFIDEDTMEVFFVNARGKRHKASWRLLISLPPTYRRYSYSFPAGIAPRESFGCEVKYRANKIFVGEAGMWWTQKIIRVTNHLRLEISMLSPHQTIANPRCIDIFPGGKQVSTMCGDGRLGRVAGLPVAHPCVLTQDEQVDNMGLRQFRSAVVFEKEFPPVGHWYRLEWTLQDVSR